MRHVLAPQTSPSGNAEPVQKLDPGKPFLPTHVQLDLSILIMYASMWAAPGCICAFDLRISFLTTSGRSEFLLGLNLLFFRELSAGLAAPKC